LAVYLDTRLDVEIKAGKQKLGKATGRVKKGKYTLELRRSERLWRSK